ncbi:conserved Plasmodium protein, unknown function [Plasmodium chabaudi adami]|uniref:Nuclease associated modular domain-containing protein n=1 Tax=Plasmodium chabaudi adami TaxID=5826 RepID=A0A1D3S0N0_PLACE|nr:conserved Plasmodium protein, unknown function [Plasmodium chabaudi adami]
MFIHASTIFTSIYYILLFYKYCMHSYGLHFKKTNIREMFLPNIKLTNKSNLMKIRRKNVINYKNPEKRKEKWIDEINKVNKFPLFKNCKKKENEQTHNDAEDICSEMKENSIMSIPGKMKKNNISNELKKETKNERIKGDRNNVTGMRNDESHMDYKAGEILDTHIYDKEKKDDENVDNNAEVGNESLNNLTEEDPKNNEIIRKEENTEISTSNDLELKIAKEIELGIKKKKKKTMSEEIRKKLSELAKLRWRNEEERKKLLRCKNKFKHSEKTKQILSYKIKLKWKDENYRKNVMQKTLIFNQDENTKRRKSLILKEKWKVKEFREKMLCNRKPFSVERRKKISDIIKQKWREEGYKKKTLDAIRENYKKRKLNVGLNPNLNYIQNLIMFKQLGISPPKMRQFPEVHKEKLRGKKKKKTKKAKKSYKENWKNIYDNILDKNEFRNPIPYLGSIDHLSVSTNI